MVKSERERKPYNKEIPGIELENWITRRKEKGAKDDTKFTSGGLNQIWCVVKENDYKYCMGDNYLEFITQSS